MCTGNKMYASFFSTSVCNIFHSSKYWVTFEKNTETHVHLHVKCPLLLSKNLNMLTNFSKNYVWSYRMIWQRPVWLRCTLIWCTYMFRSVRDHPQKAQHVGETTITLVTVYQTETKPYVKILIKTNCCRFKNC